VTGLIEVTAPTTELGRFLAPRIGSSANVVSDGDRSGCLVVLTGKTDRARHQSFRSRILAR
jgi:hypothetical protein